VPGIVLGDSSSATNPLLPFFYQASGFLADVDTITFNVYAATAFNTSVANGSGTKISTGYYVAILDPSAANLKPGAHDIVWSYQVASGDPVKKVSYSFEVLSELYFRPGLPYQAYASSTDRLLTRIKMEERQSALLWASLEVERITSRHFFPAYRELQVSVRPKSSTLWIDQPIVGLYGIDVLTENTVTGETTAYAMNNNYLRVFNRHLNGMLSPDDRQNPKIQFASTGSPTEGYAPPQFAKSNLGLLIKGVFGCTDPGGPFGQVPPGIQEVVAHLAARRAGASGYSADPFLNQPGRIKSAKTRDQAVTFDTTRSRNAVLTGDPRLDAILEGYCAPAHVGVA